MSEEPTVRAGLPKSTWAHIERSPPAMRDKILRVLGPRFEAEVTVAVAVAWVPFALDARMADAVYDALGPIGTRSFYRDKTKRSLEVPILKPVVSSALRLFGASPNSFLKMLPRTWSSMSRGCGEYQWAGEGDQRGVSIVIGFPTRFYRRKEAWLESAMGAYESFFVPFEVTGTVEAADVDFSAGNARFVLAWT